MRRRHFPQRRALQAQRQEGRLVLDRIDTGGGLAHLDRQRRRGGRTSAPGQQRRNQRQGRTRTHPAGAHHLPLTGMQYCPVTLISEQNSATSANWLKPPAISRTKVPWPGISAVIVTGDRL